MAPLEILDRLSNAFLAIKRDNSQFKLRKSRKHQNSKHFSRKKDLKKQVIKHFMQDIFRKIRTVHLKSAQILDEPKPKINPNKPLLQRHNKFFQTSNQTI
jgi:hypothetical protein